MSPNETNNEFPPGENGNGEADTPLNTSKPAVAAAPGKVMVIALLAVVFVFVIIHSVFFGAPPEQAKKPPTRKEQVTAENSHSPQNELSMSTGALPAPPSMDVANTPTLAPPPPPPPPPPALLAPPSPELHASGVNDEALSKRIHSPMITMNGSSALRTSGETGVTGHSSAVVTSSDPNSAFAQSVSKTETTVVEAKRIPNLSCDHSAGQAGACGA